MICLYVEQVGGTAHITETGNTYAVLTVKDNDENLTLSSSFYLSLRLFFSSEDSCSCFSQKTIIKSYIPIRKRSGS